MSPGDPRECRLRAAECFRMAEQATSAQGRIEFNDFAKVWLRLATEFEKDNALLDMWSGPENGPVPSENLIRWIRSRKENRIMIETDGDLLQTSARIYVGLLSFA